MICIPQNRFEQSPPPPAPTTHWVATHIVNIKTIRSSVGIKSGRAEYQAFVKVANSAGRQAVVRCRYGEHLATPRRFQKYLLLDHQIFFTLGRFAGTGSRAAWDAELQRHLTGPDDGCILCGKPGSLTAIVPDQTLWDNGGKSCVFYVCEDCPPTDENVIIVTFKLRQAAEEKIVAVTDPGFYRGGDGQ